MNKKRQLSLAINRTEQQGSVLIVSLIMLLVMTLIGISGMRTSQLEERMASNMRDHDLAFQAAEAGLRAAENYIATGIISTNNFDTNGTDGLYNNDDVRLWQNINWDANDSLEYTAFDSTLNITSPPRYVIELLSVSGDAADELNLGNQGQGTGAGTINTFQITVRGTGGADSSMVYLQSTWGKRL